MVWHSPATLSAHAPGAHGASRAPHLCVPLVAHSASNFAGPAHGLSYSSGHRRGQPMRTEAVGRSREIRTGTDAVGHEVRGRRIGHTGHFGAVLVQERDITGQNQFGRFLDPAITFRQFVFGLGGDLGQCRTKGVALGSQGGGAHNTSPSIKAKATAPVSSATTTG